MTADLYVHTAADADQNDAMEAAAELFELEQKCHKLATHNGEITIEGPKGHRTFRVKSSKFGKGDKAEIKRVVGLLVGSDNESDYVNFAFATDAGRVVVWKRFRGTDEKLSAHEVYATMLDDRGRQNFEARGYKYLVSTHCTRCNRKLTDPVSIETGMGPHCRKKA
jgi:hypothetical protein